VWLAILGVAFAQDPSDWERLHDMMLLEAADHAVDEAADGYDDLARALGPDDPARSEALYWLGRLRYEQGDVDGARTVLRECVRTGLDKARCLELLGRIELDQSSITTVPVRWTFDDTTHGVVHPWRYADKGSIRIHREGELDDPMLAWSTVVDARKDDQLVVGFASPSPTPEGVRFLLRSRDLEAYVRVQVYDTQGRRYEAAPPKAVLHVPRGEMIIVDLSFDQLTSDDPAPTPFDPDAIDRLVIQDVTAFYGATTGPNELSIDDFQVY